MLIGTKKIEPSFLGQSLSEYTLVLTLVSVVSISGLFMMQDSINGGLSSLFNGFSTPSGSSLPLTPATAPSNTTGNSTNPLNTPANPGSNNGTSPSSIPSSLANNYISNLSTAIETTGANGSTNTMLQTLTAQAQKFKAEGSITQEDYNNVMGLVEKGYRIASAEKIIEEAVSKSNNDATVLASMTVKFEGQDYSIDQLRDLFDYYPATYAPGALFTDYLNEKNQVLGKITNPNANQTLTVLSEQILSTANSFAGAVAAAVQGFTPTTNDILSKSAQADALNELYASNVVTTSWNTPLPEPPSTLTTNNSNQICSTANQNGATCN